MFFIMIDCRGMYLRIGIQNFKLLQIKINSYSYTSIRRFVMQTILHYNILFLVIVAH